MIIAVTGRKGHGKDTIGDYLTDVYKFNKLSFAAKGKQVVCETFGITSEELEVLKNDPTANVSLGWMKDHTIIKRPVRGTTIPFRQFLQRLMNEGMKSAYGEMFHVNQLLPLDFQHVGHKYVICDLRFPLEAMRVKELGGSIWEVQRPIFDPFDNHSSELPLPRELVDYIIKNNNLKDHLYEEVDKTLNLILEEVGV